MRRPAPPLSKTSYYKALTALQRLALGRLSEDVALCASQIGDVTPNTLAALVRRGWAIEEPRVGPRAWRRTLAGSRAAKLLILHLDGRENAGSAT